MLTIIESVEFDTSARIVFVASVEFDALAVAPAARVIFVSSIEFDVLGSSIVVTPPINPEKTINRIVLQAVDGSPQVNLSGLEWALFKQLKPSLFNKPVAQGSLESTDPAAEIVIEISAEVAPPGTYFLVLTDANGDTTLACKVSVTNDD